jgi:hypothetical protein
MTLPESKNVSARRLSCGQCGAVFDCGLSADCWCASVPAKMPVPDEPVQDCLCPDCLRRMAEFSNRIGERE